MVTPVWMVGFSGHRPKDEPGRRSDELEGCRPRIRDAFVRYQEMAAKANGELHFFASVAEGADTIAIEVAQELKIVVHVILPMSVKRFSQDFANSPAAWDRALAIIATAGGLAGLKADEIQQLCEQGNGKFKDVGDLPKPNSKWTFRLSNGSRERPYCYYECGEEMLDVCDGLIAVHCQATQKVGGTTDVIKQANSKGLVVASIDPLTSEVEWNSAQPDWKPDSVLTELHHISEKHSAKFPQSDDDCLDAEFERYNQISLTNGRWFRYTLVSGVVLHFVAATIGIASLSFHWGALATLIELLLVVAAIGLGFLSWWKDFHEHWRQTRFAAEVLRGLKQSCTFLDPIAPLVSHHHPGWHRFAMSNSVHQPECQSADPVARLAEYHQERVVNQLDYFTSKLTPASQWGTAWKTIAKFASLLALAVITFAFLWKLAHLGAHVETAKPAEEASGLFQLFEVLVLKFLPAFLPLLASVAISLTIVTDYGRRKERYSIMANRLKELSLWFPTIRSPYAAKRAVKRCEEILLDELVEWYASNKEITH